MGRGVFRPRGDTALCSKPESSALVTPSTMRMLYCFLPGETRGEQRCHLRCTRDSRHTPPDLPHATRHSTAALLLGSQGPTKMHAGPASTRAGMLRAQQAPCMTWRSHWCVEGRNDFCRPASLPAACLPSISRTISVSFSLCSLAPSYLAGARPAEPAAHGRPRGQIFGAWRAFWIAFWIGARCPCLGLSF